MKKLVHKKEDEYIYEVCTITDNDYYVSIKIVLRTTIFTSRKKVLFLKTLSQRIVYETKFYLLFPVRNVLLITSPF